MHCKNTGLYIALFICLSIAPGLGMLFGEQKPIANEILSSPPKLVSDAGSFNVDVLDEAERYIADHFFGRTYLAKTWAELNASVFRTSVEDQVLLGTNDWLFFCNTLNDYMGVSLSDQELLQIAKKLSSIQRSLEGEGKLFLFTIAPNKNSLYPSFMPEFIPERHESSNAARLKRYLKEEGVRYVDLFEAFWGEGQTLYYRTDSHWTNIGASLAADRLLSAASVESSYYKATFTEDEAHLGDLYEMLYPNSKYSEESYRLASGFRFICENEPKGGNAITIRTNCDGANNKLFCWRDSFGIALYPYLAENFKTAVFSRATQYDLKNEDLADSDVVILEIVERNLGTLLD